ncbi:uncharacterized protein LOC124269064 [Haliotis rubra]|uniref:uncharacterized protein LOC124269064 n=1 Tax=Haliotis rubra TaxID=36100 RepID=UPI001EE51616|nr:uncharacterized protein LOC124269064 [Haliotis rubra]
MQCLQKRELITVVHIDEEEEETALVNAVIQALLKSKSVPEVLRILDYYMPERLFDGKGAAAEAHNDIEQKPKHPSGKDTVGMFLVQAMRMDQAEIVQFIIDHNGLDLTTFFTEAVFSKLYEVTHWSQRLETAYSLFPLSSTTSYRPKEKVFQRLMIWAVMTNRVKCAALFWKKGTVRYFSYTRASSD